MAGTSTTAPVASGTKLGDLAKANSNTLFALALIGMFLIILLPLPGLMMDLLLMTNITISLVILFSSIFVRKPLSLNTFPTVLLVITFLRLALNIATTRLILTRGGEARSGALEEVAGSVVATFGGLVTGGTGMNDNTGIVVGFILFIILVIIQFVVITKGATRIAEVAARFTLDSLPGKQLAIDADLNAGIIDDKEAKARREELSQQADFYGAMDGASKFVRGDAIAGILITLINVFGGLIVGMVIHDLSFGDSAKIYTILSIGDGLVAQLPAFLVSIGSGIIIARASSTDVPLGRDIAQQYTANPQVMMVVTLVLATLTVVIGDWSGDGDGLPLLPMLLLTGVCFFAFTSLNKNQLAVATEKTRKEEAAKAKETKGPEEVQSLLYIDPLEVEIGYGLIKMVDATQGGDLLERVTMIRRQMAIDLGMLVPSIRIRDNMQLEPNEYIVKIKGTKVGKGVAMAEHYLAMDSGVATGRIDGIPTTEPAFGLPALWITATEKQRAEAFGYTVVDASSVVATHLTEIVKSNAHDLLTREEVTHLIDNLKKSAPHLVEEVVGPVLKPGDIQKVLQNLLRERVSIRDLATIIETLGDYGSRTKDVEVLTEYVRNAISRSICEGLKGADGKIYCITLEPRLEDLIASGIERTDGGSYLRIEPNSLNKIMNAIASEIEKLLSGGHTPVVLCSPQIRTHVRRVCEGIQAGIHVLSFNEIDKSIEVESVGMVSRPADL
ncbi:MAG: flagellar biosynthesis protein FlhA [Planctomycetaceae bacterium]|nr:flagellar biosynthesis protein FlhA [Planctomycetaceae bacterium]